MKPVNKTVKLQQKTGKKIQGLCLPSLSLLTTFVSLCPVDAVESVFICSFFRRPLKNLLLGINFCVSELRQSFVCSSTFPTARLQTRSDNYLRRGNTAAVNTFEHMTVQPYIWCVMLQRLFGTVMVQTEIMKRKVKLLSGVLCTYVFIQPLCHEQDVTQGQFF